MDLNLIKTFGQFAGIGGLALGVFLILFREIIRKKIFPNLEKRQAYLLLRLIIVLVWSVAVLGIVSWAMIENRKKVGLYNNPKHVALSLPNFEKEVQNVEDIASLEDFIDKNKGKLVYINTQLPSAYSEIAKDDGRDVLTLISSDECNKEPIAKCATSHILLEGKNHELAWYQGMNRINGYFVISNNTEMHQGVYFSLESVARAQVLMELQKKESSR